MKPDNLSELKREASSKQAIQLPKSSSISGSKRLILIRHGESKTNLALSQYSKFKDSQVPLTINGKKQAEQCGLSWKKYCDENNISSILILHSHYQRAAHTADIIYSVLDESARNVQKRENSNIHEQKWPDCLGMPDSLVDSYLHECLNTRHQEGIYNYKFPKGGENGNEVSKRAHLFIEDLKGKYLDHSFELIIILTHSYFMRVVLKELFGWSIDLFQQIRKPGNCEGYAMTLNDGTLTLDPNQLVFKEENELD